VRVSPSGPKISMFYLFLVVVAFFGIAIYVTLILRLVPGAAEERLGVLEDLPPDLGVWKTDESSPAGQDARARGLVRQVRVCSQSANGWFRSERLVRQVRYRDLGTNEVVHVSPEEVVKRKRVKR
jgi:hypothetical protein